MSLKENRLQTKITPEREGGKMTVPLQPAAKLYTRYPVTSVILYNGTTVAHFVLGGIGMILGYGSWLGIILGVLYLVFAFVEMYVLMPVEVCPNCVYYRLGNSLCISGLNLISHKLARNGDPKDFVNRAQGTFCPNNLYIAALVIPIVAMIPSFFIRFSWPVLVIFLVVAGLLLFRFFYLFGNIACVHCRAKAVCPNAQQMKMNGNR
jgi:hypothetical protein